MDALHEREREQRGLHERARKLLGEATQELDRLREEHAGASVGWVLGETDEAELEERETEIAAVELTVRRYEAAADATHQRRWPGA